MVVLVNTLIHSAHFRSALTLSVAVSKWSASFKSTSMKFCKYTPDYTKEGEAIAA